MNGNIDMIEHVSDLVAHPSFERMSKQFDNMFCHEVTTTSLYPDAVYINNLVSAKPLCYGMPRIITLDIDSSECVSEQLYFRRPDTSYPIEFKRKDGKVIGMYSPIDNVLILCDITHRFNSFTINVVDAVMNWIDSNTPGRDILEKIVKPRDQAYLTIGDSTFMLRAVSSSSNHRDEFIKQVTHEARDTILKIRGQWADSLRREKERFERLRKSTRVMPEVSYETMILHSMRLSKAGNYLVYSFQISITVEKAINEGTKKQVDVIPPKVYDGLLHFYVSDRNIIEMVKFTHIDGQSSTHHLHANASRDVCTGTTDILGKKVSDVNEILSHKERLVAALSIINVYSCYKDSDMGMYTDLMRKLSEVEAPSMKTVWTLPRSE